MPAAGRPALGARGGVQGAVVTSSTNCDATLAAAGMADLFDAQVDGNVAAAEGLAGRPAPDTYLAAARRLEVEPAARRGHRGRAGRDPGRRPGGFGLVIGVARHANPDEMRATAPASRHGKQLFVSIAGGDWLSMHFGMTGGLRYFKGMAKDTPYERLLVSFSNGYLLAYDCQRKFGKIGLVRDPEAYLNDHDLGPDALDDDFDFKAFRQALRGRRATVKSALMNQQCIAGIGNVYSDEILFQAKIRPDTRTGAPRCGSSQADLQDP
jgi:hypothetical protein